MPFGWKARVSRREKARWAFSLNAIGCKPARRSWPVLRMRSSSAPMASTSMLSGSWPSRPSSTALSLPWPLPVEPREPYSLTSTRAQEASSPWCRRRSANRRAARIGPTVWELLGPMPILKVSNTLTAMGYGLWVPDSALHALVLGMHEVGHVGAGQGRFAADGVGQFFGQHDGRRVQVAADHIGHDRCVDHAQSGHAVHARAAIGDGPLVAAHAAGA